MRILTLDLKRFGCFTDTVLDFSEEGKGLHVIYGRNEAGKSTALRAIENFLYGIPSDTHDDWLHDKTELCIGARIEKEDGQVLDLIRRKGKASTLLDSAGNPLPEALLGQCLGGIPRDLFKSMFGFGYLQLLKGSQSIGQSDGDLATILFQAGMGITQLRTILGRLDVEKERLFTPQGRKQVITKAISDYRDATKEISGSLVRPSAWKRLKEDLARLEAKLEETRGSIASKSAKKSQYERFLQAVPAIRDLRKLTDELSGFGGLHLISERTIAEYDKACLEMQDALNEEARCQEDSRQLTDKWGCLDYIQALTNHTSEIHALHGQVGHIASARKDLPRVQSEVERLQADLQREIANLGGASALADRSFMCLTTSDREEVVGFTSKQLGYDIDSLDTKTTQLATDALTQGVDQAAQQGQIEQLLLEQIEFVGQLENTASQSLSRLPFRNEDFVSLNQAQIPPMETITLFEKELSELTLQEKETSGNIQKAEDELRDVSERITNLQESKHVPTDEELEEARKHREFGWGLVKKAWLDSDQDKGQEMEFDSERELPAAYEKSVLDADQLGDDLRLDAARVADYKSLLNAKNRLEEKYERDAKEVERLGEQIASKQRDWEKRWAGTGITPGNPREMLGWYHQYSELMNLYNRIADEQAKRERTSEVINLLIRQLRTELDRLGCRQSTDEVSLSAMIREASFFLKQIEKLTAVAVKAQQWSDQNSRAVKMDKTIAEFQAEVDLLVQRINIPGINSAIPEDNIESLSQRLTEAAGDGKVLRGIDTKLSDAKAKREEAQQVINAATGEAGVSDGEALASSMAASKAYHDIMAKKQDAENRLDLLRGLGTVDELVSEIEALGADSLEGLLQQTDQELEELGKNREGFAGDKHTKEQKMSELEASDSLTQAIEKQQDSVARLRQGVNEYLRLHLASEILRLEIDKYGKENQEPVLARAGEIFRAVTLGSFDGVRVDFDDKDRTIIVGVRPNGKPVLVPRMSDGSRDQLYLALRIASVEHHVESALPLPFTVDDILIEFDDYRSMVALREIAQMSKKTQVLFFTHHKRLVEQVKEALDESCYTVHELSIPNP